MRQYSWKEGTLGDQSKMFLALLLSCRTPRDGSMPVKRTCSQAPTRQRRPRAPQQAASLRRAAVDAPHETRKGGPDQDVLVSALAAPWLHHKAAWA
jgi:hypothetical protein